MSKQGFIETEIAKNQARFGIWGSKSKKDSPLSELGMSLMGGPKNAKEALQHGNALAANGNYPLGTSDCFNVGISGGCGTDCFVYREGLCDVPEEMVARLETKEDTDTHNELYPKATKALEAGR